MGNHKFTVTLPIPPSHNNLIGSYGSRRSRKPHYTEWLRKVRLPIAAELKKMDSVARGWITGDRLQATIDVYWSGGRDLDNAIKATVDALQENGVYRNDQRIARYVIEENDYKRRPLQRGEQETVTVTVVSMDPNLYY